MTLMAFVHLLQALIVVHRTNGIPFPDGGTQLEKRLTISLIMIPIYVVLALLVNKST